MSVVLHHGDCLDILPTLGPVDSIVCDPPYHLLSTVKRFGSANSTPPTSAAHGRVARGFMGQQWDGGDIAFRAETWRAALDVLKPGGFLLAFGGTRTWHRLACAIEDAGFVVQDCLMWIFGTGFPKRRDALKPAYEPIVMAYKPGGKRKLQIDECRVEASGRPLLDARAKTTPSLFGAMGGSKAVGSTDIGRWPANLCHDGSDEALELFPANRPGCKSPSNAACESIYRPGQGKYNKQGPIYGDDGSAARFFYCAKANKHDRAGSTHPTVKPQALMRWLVQLVTPPSGTVLDPFAGSGTTGVAALATSRNAILIEREAQYLADIRERLAFYEGGGAHSVKAKNRNRPIDHGPLFAGAAE